MAELTPEQQAQLAALLAANGVAYEQLEDNLVNVVLRLLAQLNGRWFTESEVKRVAGQIADVVDDAQVAVMDLTEGYLDRVFETMNIQVPRNRQDLHVSKPAKLRQIDVLEEWLRPARDARVSRLLGVDELEASEKARKRAEQQARMDVALARREAERQRWGLSEDVIGYRRILRPELSERGPCALCIVAATRVYSKAELKPLHGGCVCDVLPVTLSFDPGFDLNRDDLDAIYEKAGGNTREDLIRKYGFDPRDRTEEDARKMETEHGELGPILIDPRFKHRDKDDAEALAKKGLDPQRVFDAQDAIVKKLEKDIADGKTVPAKMLETHRKWRDTAAKRLRQPSDTLTP